MQRCIKCGRFHTGLCSSINVIKVKDNLYTFNHYPVKSKSDWRRNTLYYIDKQLNYLKNRLDDESIKKYSELLDNKRQIKLQIDK